MTPALRDLAGPIDGNWLEFHHDGSMEPSDASIDQLRSLLSRGWRERAVEYGLPSPSDLSGSCKFGSLLVKVLLGGEIRGNHDHVHNLVNGRIVDLSADAADVAALSAPYKHDEDFIWSEGFCESLDTCMPRIIAWADIILADTRPPVSP